MRTVEDKRCIEMRMTYGDGSIVLFEGDDAETVQRQIDSASFSAWLHGARFKEVNRQEFTSEEELVRTRLVRTLTRKP